jgi:hypothetical protein
MTRRGSGQTVLIQDRREPSTYKSVRFPRLRVRLVGRVVPAIFAQGIQGVFDRTADLLAGILLNLVDLARGFERKLAVRDRATSVKTGRLRQKTGCLIVGNAHSTELLFQFLERILQGRHIPFLLLTGGNCFLEPGRDLIGFVEDLDQIFVDLLFTFESFFE